MATPADLKCPACSNPYQFRQSTLDRRPIVFEGPPFHTVCAECFERLSKFVELARKFECPFCQIIHDVKQSHLNAPLLEILGVAEQHGIVAENRESPSEDIEDPVDEEVRRIVEMSGAFESLEIDPASEILDFIPTRPSAPVPESSPLGGSQLP